MRHQYIAELLGCRQTAPQDIADVCAEAMTYTSVMLQRTDSGTTAQRVWGRQLLYTTQDGSSLHVTIDADNCCAHVLLSIYTEDSPLKPRRALHAVQESLQPETTIVRLLDGLPSPLPCVSAAESRKDNLGAKANADTLPHGEWVAGSLAATVPEQEPMDTLLKVDETVSSGCLHDTLLKVDETVSSGCLHREERLESTSDKIVDTDETHSKISVWTNVQTLQHCKSAQQDIRVVQHPVLGKALLLDGIIQFSERDERCYTSAIVCPILNQLDATPAANVLIIGGGDLFALTQLLQHAAQKALDWHITVVEIDRRVPEICSNLFDYGGTVRPWTDKHVTWVFEDALEWTRVVAQDVTETRSKFDAIIVDCTDEKVPMSSGFFRAEWFERVLRHLLRPDGTLTQQIGFSLTDQDANFISKIQHLITPCRRLYRHATFSTTFMPSYSCFTWFLQLTRAGSV